MALKNSVLVMLCVLGVAPVCAQSVGADKVKAAYVFNFAKFIEWPAESLPTPDSALNFCTLGRSPVVDELDSFVRDKNINGHAIVVKHLHDVNEIRSCHLVFLARGAEKQEKPLLAVAKGLPVLLVSETSGFARSGGTIELLLEAGKLVFEINVSAAESAHLKVNSRLLALGRVVSSREEKQAL